MEVLIVAKTKWGQYFCVGAIEISTQKFLRLMDFNGGYQPINTPFKIGQVWDVDYLNVPGRPPHIEDVIVKAKTLEGDVANLKEYISLNFPIWKGDPNKLFESKLSWKNASGFLNNPSDLPANSVGFWICDKDLLLIDEYYVYQTTFSLFNRRIKYKGEQLPIATIPSGTLIRVSLAKWWKMNEATEERCYLQLSGWYL